LTDDKTVRRWDLLAHTFEAMTGWVPLSVLVIGVVFAPVLIRADLLLLGLDAVVIGTILLLKPVAAVRFFRYLVSTRPPYRRPFFLLFGPGDRSGIRGAAIGYLLAGAAAFVGLWLTR
jgi:hypothetical protein